jgi:hypothetical protein
VYQFVVTQLPIMFGEAKPRPRRVESLHKMSEMSSISYTVVANRSKDSLFDVLDSVDEG